MFNVNQNQLCVMMNRNNLIQQNDYGSQIDELEDDNGFSPKQEQLTKSETRKASTKERKRLAVGAKVPQSENEVLSEHVSKSNFKSSSQIREDECGIDNLDESQIIEVHSNFQETKQIHDLVQVIEKDFTSSKKDLNFLCLQSHTAEVVLKTHNHSYKLIKDNVQKMDPNFDQQKIDSQLHNLYVSLNETITQFNKFKGEHISIHETIINKDLRSFKLEQVKKVKGLQETNLAQFPKLKILVDKEDQNIKKFTGLYHQWEVMLFQQLVNETEIVVEDTNQFMEQIDTKFDQMTQIISQAKHDISSFVPITKEQKDLVNKIMAQIANAEKVLEAADEAMERHDQTKEKLQIIHANCREFSMKMKKLELTEMIEQSKQIEIIIKNHKEWVDLYNQLKQLKDHQIDKCDINLQVTVNDIRKLLIQAAESKKEEYDELIRQIQKTAKAIRDGGEEQKLRLDNFSEKYLVSDVSKLIAENEILFLEQEVQRFQNSIQTMQHQKDMTLDESTRIDANAKQKMKQQGITIEDLHILRSNLKTLEKQLNIDLPRIKQNIDQLEGFGLKAMKNRLNEDNKKSQAMINKMKRNYEDLQKEIDDLNSKLSKVRDEFLGLQHRLDTEDKEKENDFKFKIEDKISDCDRDINGLQDTETQGQLKSLVSRKKEIIASINKMVNTFNENNKMIKEINKVQQNEKELNDLIAKNVLIQQECIAIDEKITQGKLFADQIDERLSMILNPVIPQIEVKYEEKNEIIDQCDDVFDKCEEKLQRVDGDIKNLLKKLNDAIQKMNDNGPINNPNTNPQFANKLSNLKDKTIKLMEKVEAQQQELMRAKDNMMDVIQPLNELGEREVKTPEVQRILQKLKEIEDKLNEIDGKVGKMKDENDVIQDALEKLLQEQKADKIKEADKKLSDLTKALGDLDGLKKDCKKKLKQYQDQIADAKLNPYVQNDPNFQNMLKKLEKEAAQIGEQLKDIEIKADDLRKKRDEAKKLVDDAFANPENFNPQQIDAIIENVDDMNGKVAGLNDKIKVIDKDLDRRIAELADLLLRIGNQKELENAIKEALARMGEDLASMKDVLSKMPQLAEQLIETLQEMKKGSIPDNTADYWEERKDIEKWIKTLTDQQVLIKKLQNHFNDNDSKFKDLSSQAKKVLEVPVLESLLKEINEQSQKLMDKLEESYDVQDEVTGVQKEMKDCAIPVNIKVRANQIDQLREKLENLHEEFNELKAADDAYEGTAESERDIKDLISKIQTKLNGHDQELGEYKKTQKMKMETYTQKQIMDVSLQAGIVRDIRQFKEKIEDTMKKLDGLEDWLRDLNEKLIAQDMNNAVKLISARAADLRKRLTQAKSELKKIDGCGKEMDGNTTQNEEEEFIDALKEEMPEVFKNIEGNFTLLDKIDNQLKQVEKNKSIEAMQELKGLVNDAQTKVEQCESLVNKLENEIIEWDAFKKLCRRDEELEEIKTLINEFKVDLAKERTGLASGKAKQEEFLEKAADNQEKEKKDSQQLLEGIKAYSSELDSLDKDVKALDKDREECFKDFDADLPQPIKNERPKRVKGAKAAFNDKATAPENIDMYQYLHINCQYRKRIHELLKQLRMINQRRRELGEKYAALKKDLAIEKQVRTYKAVKGDKIDEMWCEILNRANLDLDIQRISAGKYLFGSRNIICKIVNGKLLVRVGGGYMSAEEFVEQYGKMEMLKAMHQSDDPNFEEARKSLANVGSRRSGSNPRASAMPNEYSIGMAEMKEKMKNDLLNAKTYEETSRIGGGKGGGQSASNNGKSATQFASITHASPTNASARRLKSPK